MTKRDIYIEVMKERGVTEDDINRTLSVTERMFNGNDFIGLDREVPEKEVRFFKRLLLDMFRQPDLCKIMYERARNNPSQPASNDQANTRGASRR